MILSFLSGIVGSIIPKAMDLYDASAKRKQEIKLLELETERLIKVGQVEAERDIAVAGMDLQKASMGMDVGLDDAHKWVKDVNALVRPWLTVYLVVCASVIAYTTYDADLKKMIVASVLELSGLACGFWFGGRQIIKRG